MATDIAGLFGITPQAYNQQQQQLINAEAQQFAQLDPYQQVTAGAYGAGRQLGRGIVGALGGEDPQLKIISLRNQIMKNVNPNDPESIFGAAQELMRQGDQAGGLTMAQEARRVQESGATVGLREAQAQKARNWERTLTDSASKRNILSQVEVDLSEGKTVDPATLNQAKLIILQESRPKTSTDAEGRVQTIQGIDVNEFPNLAATLKKGGVGGGANVTTTETTQSLEVLQKQKEAASEAVSKVTSDIKNVDEALKLFNESPNLAGGWGSIILSGVPNTDAKTLQNLTKSIKSAFAVEEIEKLKTQSKTGATGFGSLAVKELETIQSAATALDPADKNFPQQLGIIKASFERWKKMMESRGQKLEERSTNSTQQTNSAPAQQTSAQQPVAQTNAPKPPQNVVTQANVNEQIIQATIDANVKKGKKITREQAVQALTKAGVLKGQ
jgi:hypothetical protein